MTEASSQDRALLAPVHEARATVEALREALERLQAGLAHTEHPFGAQLDALVAQLDEAARQLDAPTLTLATVGTTSSGKSTLLNGLIGRRLAPIDSDEMSAGLMEIHHGEEWSCAAVGGEGGAGASDLALSGQSGEDAVYAHVRQAMEAYHRARREVGDGVVFPHFVVTCPLFPLNPNHEFSRQLGGTVRLRAIDLPGLRTVDDRANLELIQQRVRRAFNLITLDYVTLFQREQRDVLLGELEQVVRELGGELDTMLFIMNRVDLRTSQDSPLEDCIAVASQAITERLKPVRPVEVIPFSGLLYFHASRLSMAFLSQDVDRALVVARELREDCGAQIEEHLYQLDAAACRRYLGVLGLAPAEGDVLEDMQDALEEQWQRIGRSLKRQRPLRHEELAFLTGLTFDASGHALLWSRLLASIRRNTAAVLIYPVVSGLLPGLDKLLRELSGYSRVQQFHTREQLDEALRQLDTFQRSLGEQLNEEAASLAREQRELLDFLSGEPDFSDGETYQRFIEFLRGGLLASEREHTNLFRLPFIVQELKKELNRSTLRKLRGFIRRGALSREVESYFAGRVPAQLARELADAYERLTRDWNGALADEGMSLRLDPETQRAEVKRWRAVQKNMAAYFLSVRRVLTYETERFLRSWGKIFSREVGGLVRQQAAHVWERLPRETASQAAGLGAALGDRPVQLQLEEVPIPDEVLSVPEPAITTDHVERRDGEERVLSCYTRQVTREVAYVVVELPSVGAVTDQLNAGINAEEQRFYRRIYGWFGRSMSRAHEGLRAELDDYFAVLRQGIEDRQRALEEDAGAVLARWSEVDDALHTLREATDALSRAASIAPTARLDDLAADEASS